MKYKRDNSDLKKLGIMCREFRREHGILLRDIAFDLDYSIETISAFELGKINTSRVLLWYVVHGFDADYISEFNKRGILQNGEV